MRKALAMLLAVVALTLTATAGCKDKDGDQTPANEIKIGVFLSTSGDNADFGITTRNGIELAVEEINAKGGVNGKKLVLVSKDTNSRAEQAQTVAKELATQDKVAVAIGSVESGHSGRAAPVFQEAGIPMVSPSSTNPSVTKAGDCIFRVCFIDDFQGAACGAFAYRDLEFRKAAIIFDQGDDYSKGLADFFRKSFTELGGTIVAEAAFGAKTSDFKDQVTKIAAANPDVIFAPVYYSSIGLIARDFRKQGVRAPLLGGDGWESPQLIPLAGDSLEGCYFGYHYDPEDSDPKVQNYLKAYKAKFGTEPNSLSALGYDAVYTVVKAIELGGGDTPAQIKDGLTKVKDFHGVTGTFTIDGQRNARKPITMLKISGSDIKKVKVIQPSDIK